MATTIAGAPRRAGSAEAWAPQVEDDAGRQAMLDRRAALAAIAADPSLAQGNPQIYEQALRFMRAGEPEMQTYRGEELQGPPTERQQAVEGGIEAGRTDPKKVARYVGILSNPSSAKDGDELLEAIRWQSTAYTPRATPTAAPESEQQLGDQSLGVVDVPPPPRMGMNFQGEEGGAGVGNIFGSEATYLREQADMVDRQASAKEALALAKGHEEGYYAKQVKAWTEYGNARNELAADKDLDIQDLKLGAEYPGILGGAEEIRDLRLRVDRAKNLMQYPDQPISKEEADQIMAEGSEAHARLASGQQIDQFRAFGGVGSKILAIGAMGASALGSGDNAAYKIIMNTIENDVEAQKDLFNRVGGRVSERQTEYQKALESLKDERAAKIMTESLGWGRAASQLNAQIGLTGDQAKAAGLRALAARVEGEAERKEEEAKEAALDAASKRAKEAAQVKRWGADTQVKFGKLAVTVKKEERKNRESYWNKANKEGKLQLDWSKHDALTEYRDASLGLKMDLAVLKNKYDEKVLALRRDNLNLSDRKFKYSQVLADLNEEFRQAEMELVREENDRKQERFEATHGLAEDKQGWEKEKFETTHGLAKDKHGWEKEKFETTEDRKSKEFAVVEKRKDLEGDRRSSEWLRESEQRDRQLGLNEMQVKANIKHRSDSLAFDEKRWANLSAKEVANHAVSQGRLTLDEKKHLDAQLNRKQLTLKESMDIERRREEMADDKERFKLELEMKQDEYADRVAREEKKAQRQFDIQLKKDQQEAEKQQLRIAKLEVLRTKAENQKSEKDRRWEHTIHLHNLGLSKQEGSVHMPGWKFTGSQAEMLSRQPGISEKVRDRNAAQNNLIQAVEEALSFANAEGALFPIIDWEKKPAAAQIKGNLVDKLRQAHGFGVISQKFEIQRLETLAGRIGEIYEAGLKGLVTKTNPVVAGLEELVNVQSSEHRQWMDDYGYKRDHSGKGAPVQFHTPKSPETPWTGARGAYTRGVHTTDDVGTEEDDFGGGAGFIGEED